MRNNTGLKCPGFTLLSFTMGLADRHYMREPTSHWRFSATVSLVIVLAVAFVFQKTIINPNFEGTYLALSLDGLKRGFVWQVLSFQFLHANLLHLLFNGFTLWMFGREVEEVLGKPRFLTLYFLSGAIGGLVQALLALISDNLFGGTVVGASAGIFGVVAAYAMIAPNRELTMLAFFIIPINIKAKMLLWFSVALAVVGIFLPNLVGPQVAHAAHLGGILTGVVFMKFSLSVPESAWNPFESKRRKRELIKAVSIKIPKWPAAEGSGDATQEEFISREVDPILDKISQHGIQSLTEQERKILEKARNKMAKR
jgi:membrane associated rhomboid family serine protease